MGKIKVERSGDRTVILLVVVLTLYFVFCFGVISLPVCLLFSHFLLTVENIKYLHLD